MAHPVKFESVIGSPPIQTHPVATTWLLLAILLLLSSCQTGRRLVQPDQLNARFDDHFTGFILLDPETGAILSSLHADRYFTPASNTKILTVYTALQLIPEQRPVFRTYIHNDQYYLSPTGYPLQPLPHRPTDQGVFRALQALPGDTLFLLPGKTSSEKYGPGWAWDDHLYGFQTERRPMSLYGNALHLRRTAAAGPLRAFPPQFLFAIDPKRQSPGRDPDRNLFTLPVFPDSLDDIRLRIPFLATDSTFCNLLEQRLLRPVRPASGLPAAARTGPVIYAHTPIDSLYKFVLQESDNHIAEQLLLHASSYRSDTLSVERVITLALDSLLGFLPDTPVWVDGSGLSRYNLVSPRSIALVLRAYYQELELGRLLQLFPAGGRTGTIQNWYAMDPPFIFAKTGTLRNNHSLSGFIRTRSGRLLIFSFMHANFTGSSRPIKEDMDTVLRAIYRSY